MGQIHELDEINGWALGELVGMDWEGMVGRARIIRITREEGTERIVIYVRYLKNSRQYSFRQYDKWLKHIQD